MHFPQQPDFPTTRKRRSPANGKAHTHHSLREADRGRSKIFLNVLHPTAASSITSCPPVIAVQMAVDQMGCLSSYTACAVRLCTVPCTSAHWGRELCSSFRQVCRIRQNRWMKALRLLRKAGNGSKQPFQGWCLPPLGRYRSAFQLHNLPRHRRQLAPCSHVSATTPNHGDQDVGCIFSGRSQIIVSICVVCHVW